MKRNIHWIYISSIRETLPRMGKACIQTFSYQGCRTLSPSWQPLKKALQTSAESPESRKNMCRWKEALPFSGAFYVMMYLSVIYPLPIFFRFSLDLKHQCNRIEDNAPVQWIILLAERAEMHSSLSSTLYAELPNWPDYIQHMCTIPKVYW